MKIALEHRKIIVVFLMGIAALYGGTEVRAEHTGWSIMYAAGGAFLVWLAFNGWAWPSPDEKRPQT